LLLFGFVTNLVALTGTNLTASAQQIRWWHLYFIVTLEFVPARIGAVVNKFHLPPFVFWFIVMTLVPLE
jgi:hypothetical protein